MKIFLVGNYFYPEHIGGVEVVSYNLVKHYRQFGHQVRWAAADVPPRFRKVEDGDVPVRAWNITEEKFGFPHPIPFPMAFVKLYSHIKWADVVHLHDVLYPINVITFLWSKILKKPILITQHAKIIPYSQAYKQILQYMAYFTLGRIMFFLANQVIFVTVNVQRSMRKIIPGLPHGVVNNGVDVDFYSPLPNSVRTMMRERMSGSASTPIILFVGRMVERKGIRLLQPIIAKHKNWHWILVGRPDDIDPGEWQASNMTHIQYVEENRLRELYASADILLHPSVGEGITLIVSECMSCGTPVILTNESLYEVDELNRRLFFSTQPDTDDIETTLERALVDISKLEELRAEVRSYALQRLSWKRVSEQYLSILSAIKTK